MVARAYTVAFQGVEARLVEVQCAIAAGLPAFNLVGLPERRPPLLDFAPGRSKACHLEQVPQGEAW
jgi:hypothetical protein